jgi:4-amino-4-deoxy-L-arabinose transferase-like glycosyltransferase
MQALLPNEPTAPLLPFTHLTTRHFHTPPQPLIPHPLTSNIQNEPKLPFHPLFISVHPRSSAVPSSSLAPIPSIRTLSPHMALSLPRRTTLVILLAATVYLLGNDRVPLWDRDEPRYAQTSRQMLQSGNWVEPFLLDKPRTAKPILIYWCQASAMRLLGNTSEFAARLPSALAMAATLTFLAIVIGKNIGHRRALWTILILSTSLLVIAAAKMCITDSVLLLWITIAQVSLYAIYAGRREWWIAAAMWAAIALAMLTKGPVVLGVQATTIIVLALFDVGWAYKGDWAQWKRACRWWKRTHPLLGLLIIAAIDLPWVIAIQRADPTFLKRAFLHEVVDRAHHALEGHKGPPGFYLLSIWGTFFPWSVFLPLTFLIAWKNRRWPVIRFSLAAVIGPWILFECIQTKLMHYVLPCFPPLAFLLADALVRCFRRKYPDLHHKLAQHVMAGWAVLIALLGCLPWLAYRFFAPLPPILWGASICATLGALVYGLTIYTLFRRGHVQRGAAIMGLGTFAAILLMVLLYLPHAPFMHVPQRVADILLRQGATHRGDVIMIDYQEDSLYYYQGGTIRQADEDYWEKTPPAQWSPWAVITRDVWEAKTTDPKHPRQPLPPLVKERMEIVQPTIKGWAYADGGRIVEVIVLRRR